jgi:hypothetical protein
VFGFYRSVVSLTYNFNKVSDIVISYLAALLLARLVCTQARYLYTNSHMIQTVPFILHESTETLSQRKPASVATSRDGVVLR